MNRAIVRTSDPARQPHVHATTASAPADSDVYDTGCFAFSVACYRDCAVLLVSGVWGDIIETRVTCHDSRGSHERRATLSYGHRFRQRWQDVDISVYDGVTPGYASHDVCAIWRHPRPG